MFGIGFPELVFLAILALLIIGPKELPKMARELGRTVLNLRRTVEDFKSDIQRGWRIWIDSTMSRSENSPPPPGATNGGPMITVDEAVAIILGEISASPEAERVSVTEALGRVLAEEVVSRREHPPWDNSAMDGYAVRSEDVRTASPQAPVPLKVVGEVRAGRLPERDVGRGEAFQIMTGAPIPPGADSVVPVEDTRREGETVHILDPSEKGEFIRLRGEDIHEGEKVILQGTRVRPAEVGMLATAGYPSILVSRRPEISILATGDELAEPGDPLGPGKILNSNSYSIGALVRESGARPVVLDRARDDKPDLEKKVLQALAADAAIVVGGVSKGKYDYVKEILAGLGCEMKFWQVSMRPGHPLAFGVYRGKPFFGLPGNPVSCMVTFYQFVRPALRKMMGLRDLFLPTVEGVLEEDIRRHPGRREFMRGVAIYEKGAYRVRRTGGQGSGILLSMVRANSLVILPEDRGEFKAGEKVQVQLLPGTI
jgi:molybdopterin molybdotransferase